MFFEAFFWKIWETIVSFFYPVVQTEPTFIQLAMDRTKTLEQHPVPFDLYKLTLSNFSLDELVRLAQSHPEVRDSNLWLQAIRSHHPTLEQYRDLDKSGTLPFSLEESYDRQIETSLAYTFRVKEIIELMGAFPQKKEFLEKAFRKAFARLEEDVLYVKVMTEEIQNELFFQLDLLESHITSPSLAIEFEDRIRALEARIEGNVPSPEPCP